MTKVAVKKLITMNLLETSRSNWIKFSHDRIQEAAASWVVARREKVELQLQIGRVLEAHLESDTSPENGDWLFFTSVDLLNKGSQHIIEEQERLKLSDSNRLAAKKAAERSAFLPAACYNEAAIAILGTSSWLNSHKLTMELHDAAADCYLMCGRSEKSFELARDMVEHSYDAKEQLRGKYIQLEALEHQRRFDEGRELGLVILRSLGERFPRKPNKLHIVKGLLQTKRLVQQYSDDELLNLPTMTDENEILIAASFGMGSYGCWGLLSFGNVLGQLNDSKEATRLGRLSLALSEKFCEPSMLPTMNLTYYYMSHHWRNPIQSTIVPLVNAYTVGMKVGDVQVALLSGLSYCGCYLYSSLHLDVLEKDLCKFIAVIQEYNLQIAVDLAMPFYQFTLIMTGNDKLVTNPTQLSGCVMNEQDHLRGLREAGSVYAEYVVHTMKLRALVFLGSRSEDTLREHRTIRSRRFENEIRADFGARQDDFYGALAAIACYKKSRKKWQLRYARRLIRQMDTFVKDGAINCVHMLLLLKAEMMASVRRVPASTVESTRKDKQKAFNLAISSATRSGFCQDAGLACERAALYHTEFGDTYSAEYYWHQAFEHYMDWGAGRKLSQLKKLHTCLRNETHTVRASGRMNSRSRYEEGDAQQHRSLAFW